MTWNPNDYERELLVENHGSRDEPRYKLTGWIRIRRPDGQTFLEPIPHASYFRQVTFSKIDFVAQHHTDRTDSANELTLTGGNTSRDFGGAEVTREEMRQRVLLHLNDSVTTPIAWSTDTMSTFLHEGMEVVAEEARAWRRTVYLPKRDGAQFYDLATIAPDCMAPYRIWDHARSRRLEPTTMHQLNTDRYRWLSTTSTQPDWWYPVSWGRFGVYPGTAEGGGLLRVDYLAWPPALLDDDDEPETPEPDHDAYVYYAEYLGLIQQWEGLRASERFVRVVAEWTDARARNEIQRVENRLWQRSPHRYAARQYRS